MWYWYQHPGCDSGVLGSRRYVRILRHWRGMDPTCAQTLTSLDIVVEALARWEWRGDGWSFWVRHRHACGRFTDCAPLEYNGLTHAELGDVILAHLEEWGPVSAPRR